MKWLIDSWFPSSQKWFFLGPLGGNQLTLLEWIRKKLFNLAVQLEYGLAMNYVNDMWKKGVLEKIEAFKKLDDLEEKMRKEMK